MYNSYTSLEKMKYKKDKLSYALVLLGLIVNVAYFITIYKTNLGYFYTIDIGVSVLYNLLFMLFTFLAAENIKNYNQKFDYVLFFLGAMQIARAFYYPKEAYVAQALTKGKYTQTIIFLCISGVLLISAGIISFYKSTILRRFVKGKIQKEKDY